MSKKIEKLIAKAGVAINNSLQNEELLQMLAGYGYNAESIGKGKTYLDTVSALNISQKKEYGEQYQSTNDLEDKNDAAYVPYIKFVQIARIAFAKEPGVWQALGLAGERMESYPGLISQYKQFYTNLKGNEAWLTKLGGFGVTAEKLSNGEALAAEVEAAVNNQKKEIGEAQQATRQRDEAADILKAWYSDFIAIARIALQEKPQYLEMLGVVVK